VTAARWTRGGILRAAVAGSAVAAGSVVLTRDSTPLAAQSDGADADILNLFLTLERVQAAFYRAAVQTDRLDGSLLTFATTVGAQEREHVAFLERQLGDRAQRSPQTALDHVLATPDDFRDAAIELEEAAIAAYIGQAANLDRATLASVATLVSVEARQVAWVRDLARTSPAPHAADPARPAEEILADLRRRGFVR
jgi:ferritin-like protein